MVMGGLGGAEGDGVRAEKGFCRWCFLKFGAGAFGGWAGGGGCWCVGCAGCAWGKEDRGRKGRREGRCRHGGSMGEGCWCCWGGDVRMLEVGLLRHFFLGGVVLVHGDAEAAPEVGVAWGAHGERKLGDVVACIWGGSVVVSGRTSGRMLRSCFDHAMVKMAGGVCGRWCKRAFLRLVKRKAAVCAVGSPLPVS